MSYRKAIEIKTDLAEAHFILASVLKELGKSKEALSHLIKSVELKPEEDDYIKSLTIHLMNMGNFELASIYLINGESNTCQSLYLGCLLSLDREKDFHKKYEEISKSKVCNLSLIHI